MCGLIGRPFSDKLRRLMSGFYVMTDSCHWTSCSDSYENIFSVEIDSCEKVKEHFFGTSGPVELFKQQ